MCKSTEGCVGVCVCDGIWGGFSEIISTKRLTGRILTKAQRKSSINFDCYYYYQWVCLEKDTAWVRGFPGWLSGKRIRLQCRRPRFHHWVRKIPWRWAWQPTPVLLPGESHGQRSLVDYSPWGCRESEMTEHAHLELTGGQQSRTLPHSFRWRSNLPTLSVPRGEWWSVLQHLVHSSLLTVFYSRASLPSGCLFGSLRTLSHCTVSYEALCVTEWWGPCAFIAAPVPLSEPGVYMCPACIWCRNKRM